MIPFLRRLAAGASGQGIPAGSSPDDPEAVARWLTSRKLAAAAFGAVHGTHPALAAHLKRDAARAAAANLALFDALDRIETRFDFEAIPMVLLKGAAVAASAYPDAAMRPMTDIDIWVRPEEMDRAVAVLQDLGFEQQAGLSTRPFELQKRSGGEIPLTIPGRTHGLIELHFSAFQGWWAQRAAAPDVDGVWSRSEPMGPGRHARRLVAEDAVIQTAFHVVVNQFGQAPLRGMLDLAVMARTWRPDWRLVAERARSWRLATAIWIVLDIADAMYGLPGVEPALAALRPPAHRRALVRSFVTVDSVLAGRRDLTRPARRHPFMLVLVDRPRDAARLIGRTVWPEPWWLAARYGAPTGRIGHLRWLLSHREV